MDDVHDDTIIENGSAGTGKAIIAGFCVMLFIIFAYGVANIISGHGGHHSVTTSYEEDEQFDGPDEIVNLTDADFEEKIKDGVVLVDFWMDQCGPCERMAPAVKKLAYEMKGKAVVAKLHMNTNQKTTNQLGINLFPTIAVYRDGEVVDYHEGGMSYSQLHSMLDAALNKESQN